MKKLPLLLLFTFCMVLHISAQEKQERPRNNIVKFNLSSLLLKAGCVQYERILPKGFSLTANIITRPMSTFSPAFTEGNWRFIQTQFASFSFTPGLRYYYGKKKGSGLYTELYARYRRDKASFLHAPGSSTNGFSTLSKEHMFIAGVLGGIQIVRKDHMVIDFWILGFGYGSTSFTGTSVYTDRYQSIYSALDESRKNNFESSMKDAFGAESIITWDGHTATQTRSEKLIPFRGFGFNVGINF